MITESDGLLISSGAYDRIKDICPAGVGPFNDPEGVPKRRAFCFAEGSR